MRIVVARGLSLALSVASCGGGGQVRIEEATQPYVVEFVADATRRNIGVNLSGLTVEFARAVPGDPTVGLCFPLSKTVQISYDFWRDSDAFTRRQIVYHELGHCLLRLKHVEGKGTALMNPWLFGHVSAERWVEIVDAMFKAARRE